MDKYSLFSIEKFAAFLDVNLTQDEMQQFSQMAEQDEMIHQMLDASSIIDDTIASFSESDLQSPPEIAGSSFEIPSIPSIEISPFITLTPSPTDDIMVAAACAEEDFKHFSNNPSIDNIDNPSNIIDSQETDENVGFDVFTDNIPDIM